MVDVAKTHGILYVESCGKCVHCDGNRQMYDCSPRSRKGRADMDDLTLLRRALRPVRTPACAGSGSPPTTF